MRQKSRISFGPGAASIILIVVILCMSVLGLLSLMNARNDISLSDRNARVVEVVYELNARAERSFSSLDKTVRKIRMEAENEEQYLEMVAANLPDGMLIDERVISWTESDEYRQLECKVSLTSLKEEKRLQWLTHRMEMKTEETWSLGSF